jgi:hypothetical protein
MEHFATLGKRYELGYLDGSPGYLRQVKSPRLMPQFRS